MQVSRQQFLRAICPPALRGERTSRGARRGVCPTVAVQCNTKAEAPA